MLTPEDLISFETDIAATFDAAKIKAPIHLYHNSEEELIAIFKSINQEDWVFCTWRSHYQCLLKGVPRAQLKEAIIEGRSIGLCFPEYNIYSSGIVGGSIPIALGTALSLKLENSKARVWCFVGDMGSEGGLFSEALKYATNHNLPIKFIVEDNGKSVCTDTREVWGCPSLTFENSDSKYVYYYKYDGSKYPHAGAGNRVQF